MDINQLLQYGLIIVIMIVIGIAIIKSKKKDFNIEINKLVTYLGGKDNILNYESNKSRFTVEVRDTSLVNKEAIQKMGARGVVEIDNELKIILGENADKIKKYVDELKK